MTDDRSPYIFVLSLRDDLRDLANWTDAERDAVGAHFRMLQREAEAGRVLVAGRSNDKEPGGHLHRDVIGVGIFLAASREEAEQFVAADPAVVAGVMSVRVHAFNIAVHADPAVWETL